MTTGNFASFDGSELFYREWSPQNPNGKIVLLLHRGHEHSERLDPIARNAIFEGYKVFSYDNRGHGYTRAEATYEFMNLVRDLEAFVRFVCAKEGKSAEDIFVVANSVAGVVASTWVHDYAPRIAGMALVAPAFVIKLYIPLAKPSLDLMIRFNPRMNIKSYVKAKFLTHNTIEQERYNTDPLITPNIPARQLVTLLDTAKRIVEDASHIVTPTLVLSATSDYVVDSRVQKVFYERLSSPLKRFVELKGFYHGVLYEAEAHKAIDAIGVFMEECFNTPKTDKSEHLIALTQNEKDKIARGEITTCQKFSFGVQRFMLNTLGWMSDGMKIGLKYGFDSGVTLDYVYKNTPSGVGLLGKLSDKNYLESIGWRGIRQRKVNAIITIREKIDQLRGEGKNVKILDIAGGPARYLIELAEEYPDIEVLVRDYQEQNVEQGRALAKERGLSNIRYEQADAFDKTNYDRNTYEPNIVVVSGVFELFEQNALIQNAIEGITSMIAPNGYLVYTGQPWHPQLEQIAHVLGNHQQTQWIMRRRSQYELDTLFGSYGFDKEGMRIDDWGIFTVSSARRR
ncbi:bifunctional alpha/beta hydrolase/class I SAM-dependent methyltransferase [Sulfuricurvum sp.]|uniref:bifunctional alpha/beta hydrolase/class I SAM-dependent methyltransferase n=2 Tax=Sulfuricurvum sp. TaxID=2025608 RepID=UPI002E3052B6|nr:bifunctional alpha/beta hydrolase/class I SAM-dependent methyltransferase [Sulfuricurvum sp.]HEX5329849.1 bifunctional alpha/beta hydrolase/class I SAM-dependent methyltransferase [Sulfuricurvum sp.]